MTVESTDRKQIYSGGQSSLVFSFRALVNHPEYIKVTETLISTGVETELTYSTDYTVSLNTDGVGGTVTVSPSFSTSYTQTVYRLTDDTQESDYDDFNQFPANTIENDLDTRTLISQERSDDLARTAKLPISSSIDNVILPTPVDGKILVWSGTGGTIVNTALLPGGIPTGGTTNQILIKVSATNYDVNWATQGNGTVTSVSSNTSDIVVISTSTTPILTLNAGTAGTNKILRLDANGKLPALDASLLTNIPYFPYVKVSNTQSSGTAGGSATSGSWTIVPINTEDFDTSSIATISSSTISLPAGTYRVSSMAPFYQVNIYQTKLYNFSDSTDILIGSNGFSDPASAVVATSSIKGQFVIASTKKIAMYYQVQTTKATSGLGTATAFGTEVYAQMEFEKIA